MLTSLYSWLHPASHSWFDAVFLLFFSSDYWPRLDDINISLSFDWSSVLTSAMYYYVFCCCTLTLIWDYLRHHDPGLPCSKIHNLCTDVNGWLLRCPLDFTPRIVNRQSDCILVSSLSPSSSTWLVTKKTLLKCPLNPGYLHNKTIFNCNWSILKAIWEQYKDI